MRLAWATTVGILQHTMQRPPSRTSRPGLRLVTPGEVDEELAVETAQLHAVNKSRSWKQYLRNLDFFLGLQLELEATAGDPR